MKRKTITIDIYESDTSEELEKEDSTLLSHALEATSGAYTPYSHFQVGAAVRLSNGAIVTGSNQENAAYPSGLCAERTALFYAQSQYPHLSIEAIAIAAKSNGEQTTEPVYPCGACRQVMLEAQKRAAYPIRIIMGGAQKIQMVGCVGDLLPLTFEKF